MLWSGPALLVAGIVATRTWESLPRAHAAALIAIAGLALIIALATRKVARVPLADALAGFFAAALACFAGPLPMLATLSLAAAAYGIAAALIGAAGGGTLIAGLALSAGLLGWLLPFPLHFRFVYFLLVAAALLLTRRHIGAGIGDFARHWRAAVAETPGWAAFAALVVGLASVGCWVPTVQFDDLAYHLGLPAQLQTLGYYRMDAQSQIWALAPWSGDVIQAIAQLLAGAEARGAVDALWLVATACLSWRLAAAVGLDPRARWQSTALVASQPLLAGLAGGMQAELPATAASLALALVVAGAESCASSALLARFAILAGLLLGLKTGFIAIILPLAACLTWRWRTQLSVRGAIFAVLLAALVGGSSYFYAWLLTGNPLFPLLNGVFHSPLLDAQGLQDPRWLAPVGWDLPWQLTFHTRDYAEGWNGAAGFALLGLLGALPVALASQRTRWLALSASLAFLASILAVHYLRYTFPSLALLMPCLIAALCANTSARARSVLICVLVIANLLYQGAAAWTLHSGAITREVASLDATPTLRHFAPQRLLIATARQVNPAAVVVLCEEKWPLAAELAGRGFVIAHYDPELERAGRAADADPSGAAWRALFTRAGAGFAIIGESTASVPLHAALSDAKLLQQAGDAQLWQLPAKTTAPADLLRERDAAARRLRP